MGTSTTTNHCRSSTYGHCHIKSFWATFPPPAHRSDSIRTHHTSSWPHFSVWAKENSPSTPQVCCGLPTTFLPLLHTVQETKREEDGTLPSFPQPSCTIQREVLLDATRATPWRQRLCKPGSPCSAFPCQHSKIKPQHNVSAILLPFSLSNKSWIAPPQKGLQKNDTYLIWQEPS